MRILLASHNESLCGLIQRSLTRFRYEWVVVDNGLDAFQKAISQKFDLILAEFDLPRMKAPEMLRRFGALEHFKNPPVIVLTLSETERDEVEAGYFLKTQVISRPFAVRQFVDLVQQVMHQSIRIACLGGGTGLFTLLSGLKSLSGVHLSSIVSMSDDGGSTGKLRDIFGVLPPGDIRRSLVALSNAPDLLNELMQYRFKRGKDFEGHNLGNLLLTALSEMRGSMSHAVKAISEILNIQGNVIPVTETINTLKAELENGHIVEGEHRIDLFEGRDPKIRIKRLWQEPLTAANPDALEAIYNANYVLIGPGDLFTSIVSNLIVGGIAEAIATSRAKKIYICNIMTKPGETTDYSISDHVREVVKYTGKDVLDYVICSSTKFSSAACAKYLKKEQFPVIEASDTAIQAVTQAKIIWADIASEEALVRHDSLKLVGVVKQLIDSDQKHP